MTKDLLKIDPIFEKERIIKFIKTTLQDQRFKNVVLGMSGGIDSVTCFYLLQEAVAPENIFLAHLPYFNSALKNFKNVYELSIKNTVDGLKQILEVPDTDKIRLGNIMARVRMTILYDLAKKNNALVLGTEDKSEFLLGYFTRFGDQASDIEPIRHLYKTQVYTLAKYLNVPKEIINQQSSPDLWPGQTAEKELGFSYKEADVVLHLYHDKKMPLAEIEKMNLPNYKKVIERVKKNSFKHQLPYRVEK